MENRLGKIYTNVCMFTDIGVLCRYLIQQDGHDGPVYLHWLIHEIPSYQTLQYLGIGLKHKTSNKD